MSFYCSAHWFLKIFWGDNILGGGKRHLGGHPLLPPPTPVGTQLCWVNYQLSSVTWLPTGVYLQRGVLEADYWGQKIDRQ